MKLKKKSILLFPALVFLFLFLGNIDPTSAGTACEDTYGGYCELELDYLSDVSNCNISGYKFSSDSLDCPSNGSISGVCCIPERSLDCTDKSDRERCGYDGYCYNQTCYTDYGELGEPCGNDFGSTCTDNNACSDTDAFLPGQGRLCGIGLSCCIKGATVYNKCTAVGGRCLSAPVAPYVNIYSGFDGLNSSCDDPTSSDELFCYFQDSKCLQAGGECQPGDCSSGYKKLLDTEANESCRGGMSGRNSSANCCIANDCIKNSGQCVVESQVCDNPITRYDAECGSGYKCCTSNNQAINPNASDAPDHQEGVTGGFLLFKGSLVPCGRKSNDPGTAIDETAACTLCHFIIMFERFYDLLFSLLIIVALALITAGGVIYIISAGNPNLTGIAKGLITKTLTGFGLFLLSWLIVFTTLKFMSANTDIIKGSNNSWFEFNCDPGSALDTSGVMPATEIPTTKIEGYTLSPADISNPDQQKADASNELKEFLAFIEDELPAEAKVLSSISDSQGMTRCAGEAHNRPPCAHSKYSCHYGGGNCQGESYAVDFKSIKYEDQLRAAAKKYKARGGDIKFYEEGNHIHISVNGTACNCDTGLQSP